MLYGSLGLDEPAYGGTLCSLAPLSAPVPLHQTIWLRRYDRCRARGVQLTSKLRFRSTTKAIISAVTARP
jgi:hypothetical protein